MKTANTQLCLEKNKMYNADRLLNFQNFWVKKHRYFVHFGLKTHIFLGTSLSNMHDFVMDLHDDISFVIIKNESAMNTVTNKQ